MGKEVPRDAPKKTTKDPVKKHRRARNFNFAYYVYKVLKQVHPDCRITTRAVSVMHSMLCDILDQVIDEAGKVQRVSGRRTVSYREIQTAVRLLFPGELGKHAVNEGMKATLKYMGTK